MTKSKSTKRALVASVFSLVICFAMLIGSTFAWFTDSVTTGKNKIVAGNLDVELQYSTDGASWSNVTADTNVFKEDALWEPGYTEVVYLKVKNAGALALKYQFGINVADITLGYTEDGAEIDLSNYIKFGVVNAEAAYTSRAAARADVADSAALISAGYSSGEGHLKAGAESDMIAMVVYMPEEVGNEANHGTGKTAPSIDLGISLVATQDTVESDSFGTNYDENAVYPSARVDALVAAGYVAVETADEFTAAIASNDKIVLTEDIALTATLSVNDAAIVDLNGNTLSSSSASSSTYVASVASGASLTLSDGTVQFEKGKGIEVKGDLTLEDMTVTAKGQAVSYNSGANVSITGSTITSTSGNAVGGSGSSSNRATVEIDDCVLTSGTTSTAVSTLMYVDATIENSTITNTSSAGTAVGVGVGSKTTVENCTINAVKTAVSCTGTSTNTGTVEVKGSTLITTGNDGNTVYANKGIATVTNCEIKAAYAGVYLVANSTVNVTNSNVTAQYGVFSAQANNTVNVTSSKINVSGTDSNGCYGIYHNGSTAPVTVTVTNSEIYATEDVYMGHGIYISNSADAAMQTLTVSGSTIQGSTAVEIKHTNATISDSTLTAIGNQATQANGNGVCTSGYALAMTSNSSDEAASGMVSLSGNTYTNNGGNLLFNAANGAEVSGYTGNIDSTYAE